MKKMHKITFFFHYCVLLLIVVSFIAIISYSFTCFSRFTNTHLNITQIELVEKWGQTGEDFICKLCDNDRVLNYNTLLTYYAFKFDRKSKLLKLKYVN